MADTLALESDAHAVWGRLRDDALTAEDDAHALEVTDALDMLFRALRDVQRALETEQGPRPG